MESTGLCSMDLCLILSMVEGLIMMLIGHYSMSIFINFSLQIFKLEGNLYTKISKLDKLKSYSNNYLTLIILISMICRLVLTKRFSGSKVKSFWKI